MQNEIGKPASKPGLEHLLRIKAYSPMIIMSLCERCSSYQAKLGFENEAPSSSVDTPRAQLPGGLIVCPGIPELCQICLAPAICACKISWNQPECTGILDMHTCADLFIDSTNFSGTSEPINYTG